MATTTTQASLLLQKQLRDLAKHPVDGFSAGLVDDSNVFEWQVTIIGPPDTLYDGGYFNAIMSFPQNYPNSPPSVRFTSEMWHPNGQLFISENCIYLLHLQFCFLTSCIIFEETPVYPDGRVCISILHPPGEDPNGYELASERWTPVHTVWLRILCLHTFFPIFIFCSPL
uniref:UBC core domain-containing protein n=1 Tax=Zea mays TaxID=4577 RepID=A0A804QYR0_MAIZE